MRCSCVLRSLALQFSCPAFRCPCTVVIKSDNHSDYFLLSQLVVSATNVLIMNNCSSFVVPNRRHLLRIVLSTRMMTIIWKCGIWAPRSETEECRRPSVWSILKIHLPSRPSFFFCSLLLARLGVHVFHVIRELFCTSPKTSFV